MSLLFLCSTRLCAQVDSLYAFSFSVQADIADFTVDNLGNIYLINADNQLKKLGPKGDSLAVFNDVRRYGTIYSIDVTNPLKILIYYREFATVVTVDRFLNIRNTIDLRTINIFQAKAVGTSYDNNIWVYDEQEARLKRVGDDGSLIDQTTDLRQVLDSLPDAGFLCDQGENVYLYDPLKGIFLFDHYGAFKKLLPFTGWKDFSVIDKIMLGHNANYFFRFTMGAMDLMQEKLPESFRDARKIKITQTALYLLKAGKLDIYSRR